jgi:hypothetical protein
LYLRLRFFLVDFIRRERSSRSELAKILSQHLGPSIRGVLGTSQKQPDGYPPTDEAENGGKRVHRDVTYEPEQFPEDKTEKELEKHCAPAIRHHMQDFLTAIDARSKPVADIEQGYVSTTSCILANSR